MNLSEMIRFEIDNKDELCRFFHYAKENNILWTGGSGTVDAMVAYVPNEKEQLLKLISFQGYYRSLNISFKEGDRVQFYREKNKPVGTVTNFYEKSKKFLVVLDNGKKRSGIESHQIIHV
jgi:hypothetical protein